MMRQRFGFSVSGGTVITDTGPTMFGEIAQMRWYHGADTGQPGTLEVAAVLDPADTGQDWVIYSAAVANFGAPFTKALRQPQHGSDGAADPADTGAQFGVPIALAGERLRVKITPTDTGVVISNGKLYVWTRE